MTTAASRVLNRLRDVGFSVREGGITPFGEELPLVRGVAWERGTAQLALLAEASGAPDAEAWRQLLFAASGLRHHLGGNESPGFRNPLVLAVIDEEGERALRELVEELTTRYALFNRVDLNLVRETDLETDDALDTALAPLLPACRRMLGEAISREEVQRFWGVLREQVEQAGRDLDPVFGALREEAATELADALIGDHGQEDELLAPTPVRLLELENLRSFESAAIPLEHVTVVHGANGSGKSSVLEALELLWAGTSLRRPPGVSAEEYQRHLPRSGEGTFAVRGEAEGGGDRVVVTDVSERPQAELRRSVLTQEAVAALVESPPAERYASLLAVTGLEVPELESRTKVLVDKAKRDADGALREAGLPPLPRADSRGMDHLRRVLAGGFAGRLPGGEELAAAEQALARASGGAYAAREWDGYDELNEALLEVDSLLDAVSRSPGASGGTEEKLVEASEMLRHYSGPKRQAAQALRLLVDAVTASRPRSGSDPLEEKSADLPAELAVRWLTHADGLASAALAFRTEAEKLENADWKYRLGDYAEALTAASAAVPRTELSRLGRASRSPAFGPAAPVDEKRWVSAGFTTAPAAEGEELIPFLQELEGHLVRHADAFDDIAAELQHHPARFLGSRAHRVLHAMCRFELARHLRRQGPIMRASEELLGELLQGRLYPVVRELVAATVRFEWYFQPLRITVEGRQVLIGGLATPRADLDARLLLNSAERTVVGLAWFLALHLLQPEHRRRVLVLDDPAGGFDAFNRAGFAATLRAFVRLARPEQVVIATHDGAVAALLAEELAPVDHWPDAVAVVRCQRDETDASVAGVEETFATSRDLQEDEALLGLSGEQPLFPA